MIGISIGLVGNYSLPSLFTLHATILYIIVAGIMGFHRNYMVETIHMLVACLLHIIASPVIKYIVFHFFFVVLCMWPPQLHVGLNE
jgi:hypothetical protein